MWGLLWVCMSCILFVPYQSQQQSYKMITWLPGKSLSCEMFQRAASPLSLYPNLKSFPQNMKSAIVLLLGST